MALTINPAVSGSRKRWITHVASFFVGTALGTLVCATAVIGAVEAVRLIAPSDALLVGASAVIAWAALHDLGLPLPLPYRSRQVPEWLQNMLPHGVVSSVYGFMLGLGFVTLFTYSAHVAMLALVPFLNSILAVGAIAVTFAAGKTLVLGVGATVRHIEEVGPRFRWTRWRARTLRVLTGLASIVVAATLVVK